MIGREENEFIEGALVANDSLEFHVIHVIPIFFNVLEIIFNQMNVISGSNPPLACESTNNLSACM